MAGSITLERGGTSITLTNDLRVQRRAGRPNSTLRPTTSALPNYVDKARSASDVFELSGEFTSNTAATDAKTLQEDILRDPLGRTDLTLTFETGLFGLGFFAVVPDGSQAGRISYVAGRDGAGWVSVNTLSLRVVDNT